MCVSKVALRVSDGAGGEGRCAHHSASSHLPGKNQTQQRADEDEDLIEHGRVGPLDGAVEVVLPVRGGTKRNSNKVWSKMLSESYLEILKKTQHHQVVTF